MFHECDYHLKLQKAMKLFLFVIRPPRRSDTLQNQLQKEQITGEKRLIKINKHTKKEKDREKSYRVFSFTDSLTKRCLSWHIKENRINCLACHSNLSFD